MISLDAIDVGAVQHDVDREREAQFAHEGRRRRFCGTPLIAGDAIGGGRVRVLEGDLDVLEPGVAQLLRTGARQPDARGDERRVQPQAARVRRQLLDVRPHQRLAARQAELQDAQRARLASARASTRRWRSRLRAGPSRADSSSTGQCSGQRCVISASKVVGGLRDTDQLPLGKLGQIGRSRRALTSHDTALREGGDCGDGPVAVAQTREWPPPVSLRSTTPSG